jgi:hypothetical protein
MMGYTHYFPQQRDFTDNEWDKTRRAMSQIHHHAAFKYNVVLKGWNGTSLVECNDKTIAFNGDAKTGDDHETFRIHKEHNPDFNFCKTAYKPYDLVVCALLAFINHIAPDALDIRSDGDEEDWREALEFVNGINLSKEKLAYPVTRY